MPRSPDRTRLRRGRLCRIALALVLASVCGCEAWKSVKVDNPVLGPPPPRLSWNEAPQPESIAVADASGDDAGYVKIAADERNPLSDHSVVAIVNGEPILAGEILAPFTGQLTQAVAKGTPEWQIERVKEQTIKQYLPNRIEQTLLVQSLRLMLKKEQLEQMDEKLDEEFEKENQRIMEKFKVNSKLELEQALAEQSTSLAAYEQAFKSQQLAMLYLQTKTGERTPIIGRQEIIDAYHANIEKYEHPARAQFQLLLVSFAASGGKDKARTKLDTALAELQQGEAFPEICTRYSDDTKAKRGGQWDWLKPGEFNDPNVDAALFELPVGEVSQVFDTGKAFAVVKVTNREPAGRTPLAEVQDDIRRELLESARRQTVQDLLAELRDNAVVTTYVE